MASLHITCYLLHMAKLAFTVCMLSVTDVNSILQLSPPSLAQVEPRFACWMLVPVISWLRDAYTSLSSVVCSTQRH